MHHGCVGALLKFDDGAGAQGDRDLKGFGGIDLLPRAVVAAAEMLAAAAFITRGVSQPRPYQA